MTAADRPSVTDDTRAEGLLDTRAGLAIAHSAWGDGFSAALRYCNDDTQTVKPDNPYRAPLLAAGRAEPYDPECVDCQGTGMATLNPDEEPGSHSCRRAAGRAETTTEPAEDAAAAAVEVIKPSLLEHLVDHDAEEEAWNIANSLAAAGLLARPLPNRDDLAEHLRAIAADDEAHADRLDTEDGPTADEWDHWIDGHLTVSHRIDGKALRIEGRPETIADAVLDLLRGGGGDR